MSVRSYDVTKTNRNESQVELKIVYIFVNGQILYIFPCRPILLCTILNSIVSDGFSTLYGRSKDQQVSLLESPSAGM